MKTRKPTLHPAITDTLWTEVEKHYDAAAARLVDSRLTKAWRYRIALEALKLAFVQGAEKGYALGTKSAKAAELETISETTREYPNVTGAVTKKKR